MIKLMADEAQDIKPKLADYSALKSKRGPQDANRTQPRFGKVGGIGGYWLFNRLNVRRPYSRC